MPLPIEEEVLNPKFGVVISKTVTCRSWTDRQTQKQTCRGLVVEHATIIVKARRSLRSPAETLRFARGKRAQPANLLPKLLRNLDNIMWAIFTKNTGLAGTQ